MGRLGAATEAQEITSAVSAVTAKDTWAGDTAKDLRKETNWTCEEGGDSGVTVGQVGTLRTNGDIMNRTSVMRGTAQDPGDRHEPGCRHADLG